MNTDEGWSIPALKYKREKPVSEVEQNCKKWDKSCIPQIIPVGIIFYGILNSFKNIQKPDEENWTQGTYIFPDLLS